MRTVAGWIERENIPDGYLFPSETLFVSGDGEGSHTHAYVSRFEFVASHHVNVLLPRDTMSLLEKIFYARCITMNRHKFSYGRAPRGERLKSVELPDVLPEWLASCELDNLHGNALKQIRDSIGSQKQFPQEPGQQPLDKIFKVFNGLASGRINLSLQREEGMIPFMRPASRQQRTIAGWVERSEVPEGNIFPPHTIYVSTNGEGSHTYAYVSTTEFVPNSDVVALVPQELMSLEEKLFYAACITMNRCRFSYGRKPKGGRLVKLRLPTQIPEWVHGSISKVVNDVEKIVEIESC